MSTAAGSAAAGRCRRARSGQCGQDTKADVDAAADPGQPSPPGAARRIDELWQEGQDEQGDRGVENLHDNALRRAAVTRSAIGR